MKPPGLVIALFVAALLSVAGNAAAASIPPEGSASVADLVRQSSFIFAGTVRKLNSSTVPVVPASEGTVVVRVDEVLHNAGVLTDILGKDITVQLATPRSIKEGEKAVFFSTVATYGDSVAVRELAHLGIERQGTGPLRTQVDEALRRMPDERLQKRIEQAALIVAGTVILARPSGGTGQRVPPSEHDPEWWEATVRVQSVVKGQAPATDLVILFPHSDDVRWFASPKFKEGQQGVFLLHRTDNEQLRARGYTALDALDYQPMEQLGHIKTLMQSSH
jgi:hypothetical protein